MMRPAVAAIVALGFALPATAEDAILNIGDPAPKLAVSKWVKGEAFAIEPGKTYVVEFWATWCGPCRATIPHLTELARKYQGKVRFVGVDVWERDLSAVAPFLEEMGETMGYAVALDDVPEGGDPDDGPMAKAWMKAAEENGIPAAFLVHDGKIAWIGHPSKLDGPLAAVVAGEWDPKPHAAERLAAKRTERAMVEALTAAREPMRGRDWKRALAVLDEAIAATPALAENSEVAAFRFAALCNGADVDAGLAFGKALMEKYKDEPDALNNAFYYVVGPEVTDTTDPRVAKLAVEGMRRADAKYEGKDPTIRDTYAHTLHRAGQHAEAVAMMEAILKQFDEAKVDREHPLYKQSVTTLESFKKAAAAKDKGQ